MTSGWILSLDSETLFAPELFLFCFDNTRTSRWRPLLHVLSYSTTIVQQDGIGVAHDDGALYAGGRECDAPIVGPMLQRSCAPGWERGREADLWMRYPEALADKSFDNTGRTCNRGDPAIHGNERESDIASQYSSNPPSIPSAAR